MEFDKSLTKFLNYSPSKEEFERHEELLRENLNSMSNWIKELQEYYFKLGGEKDSQFLIEKSNELIDKTANQIACFYDQIKTMHISIEKKKLRKADKIDKMKITFHLEEECNKYKHRFDTIVYKIRKQDKTFIDSYKNSLSSIKSTSHNTARNSNLHSKYTTPGKGQNSNSAIEFIEEKIIDNKEQQIKLINRVTKKLDDISRETSRILHHDDKLLSNTHSDFDDIIEISTHKQIEILDPDNSKQKLYLGVVLVAVFILILMLFY